MDFFDNETRELAEYYREKLDKLLPDTPHIRLKKEKELNYAQLQEIYEGIKEIFELYNYKIYNFLDAKENHKSFKSAQSIVNLVILLLVKSYDLKQKPMNESIYELIHECNYNWAIKLVDKQESKKTYQYLKLCVHDAGCVLGFQRVSSL